MSKALAEKMGIKTFVGHPMGIWDAQNHLPYARKATAEKLVGDRYILSVVPATLAELIGEKNVTMNTAAFYNPDAQGGQTRAGIEMPEYAARYIDENDIIHPAVIHPATTTPTTPRKTSRRPAPAPTAATSSSPARSWPLVRASRPTATSSPGTRSWRRW